MATIRKTSAQIHALKEIRSGLKDLSTINVLLNGGIENLSVTFTKQNKKHKLQVGEKNVRQIFSRLQKKNASEIRALAEANNIVLSEKDNAILNAAEGKMQTENSDFREGEDDA